MSKAMATTTTTTVTTTTTEDFSFPIITDSAYTSPIDSPPLWRLSPAASPSQYSPTRQEEDDDDEEEGTIASHAKSRGRANSNDYKHYNSEEEDEEEKMDTLWEDFNEDLFTTTTATSTTSCSNYYYRRSSKSSSSAAGDNMVQMGCVQALKLSRNGGANAIFSPRKQPGLVVFIKVLKKLFLLQHNSHNHNRRPSSVKNRASW